jgi:hypothetical protein
MLTIDEAFKKFKGRLEITDLEQGAASRRQKAIRAQLDDGLDIIADFLTGAYARDTKTKPLRDVDIMIALGAGEARYRSKHPSAVLGRVREILVPHYGEHRVCTDRRCVRVDFGLTIVDDVSDDVMSIDVVPAFEAGKDFEIPDDLLGVWITTNPKVHAAKATEANKAFSLQWKPVVKMIKQWNRHSGEPIEPSFLIEVLALHLLDGPWEGSYPYEIRQFFASAADRLADGWPDPAIVGPNVSDVLDGDSAKMNAARVALTDAERTCTEAIRVERAGRTGEALTIWQSLFGPTFAKS